MNATYVTYYIIRFAGTITQGPNAGKTYTLESSWGGGRFDTIEQARAALANYRALEPTITTFQILSRQCVQTGRRSEKIVETVIEE